MREFSFVREFATINPENLTPETCKLSNLVGGVWTGTLEYEDLVDPMTGKIMGKVPLTQKEETRAFVESLQSVPKYGLHNPLHNP